MYVLNSLYKSYLPWSYKHAEIRVQTTEIRVQTTEIRVQTTEIGYRLLR